MEENKNEELKEDVSENCKEDTELNAVKTELEETTDRLKRLMASIYSAFANDGNMIKPYLEYKEDKSAEYLVENAFTKEAANEIKEGMIQVVENPNGTGYDAKVKGVTIAGKTGTAELKLSKDDEGDTLGWFNCFNIGESTKDSILVVGMAKNQPSSFLKKITKTLFK